MRGIKCILCGVYILIFYRLPILLRKCTFGVFLRVCGMVWCMTVSQDKYGYERELMSYLEELIVACDRRVREGFFFFFRSLLAWCSVECVFWTFGSVSNVSFHVKWVLCCYRWVFCWVCVDCCLLLKLCFLLVTFACDATRQHNQQVEKNKERLKLEQGDDKAKDGQISRLIELERVVSWWQIVIGLLWWLPGGLVLFIFILVVSVSAPAAR